jgi:hypothetical protein
MLGCSLAVRGPAQLRGGGQHSQAVPTLAWASSYLIDQLPGLAAPPVLTTSTQQAWNHGHPAVPTRPYALCPCTAW